MNLALLRSLKTVHSGSGPGMDDGWRLRAAGAENKVTDRPGKAGVFPRM